MSQSVNINHSKVNDAQLTHSPSGALLSATPVIVFDGKNLNDDHVDRWSSAGTGTDTFGANLSELAVAAGEYQIRQGVYPVPYFSGYTSYNEFTFDTFGLEDGVTKRVGQYTGSTVAPHTADLDGFCLENDGDTYRIKAWNSGTLTVDIPFNRWFGRDRIADYDFDNFTVIMFDFLWLGGAALRLWLAHPTKGWVLLHSVPYVGGAQGTIFKTPQHPMRYEIRSSTGTGTFRPICCQASVQNSIAEAGDIYTKWNATGIACNDTSTVYALQGLKRRAAQIDVGVQLTYIGSSTGSLNDTGTLLLLKNPTLSAALTYTASGAVDHALATNQTVTDVGEIIAAGPSAQSGQALVTSNYRSWLTNTIDGTFDEFVLAFAPMTSNQSQRGLLGWKEFG